MTDNASSTKILAISIRMPVLIAIVVLLIIGLVWSFILGIMVGRGYKAEEQLGAAFSGFAQAPAPALPAFAPEQNPGSAFTQTPYRQTPATNHDEQIIKSEELHFKEDLQAPVKPPVTPAQTQAGISSRSESTPQNQAATFVYIFQAASFSRESQALELIKKLNQDGIATQPELVTINAVKWYRVLVTFTGDENGVTEFKYNLGRKFKLDSLILRKKTVS